MALDQDQLALVAAVDTLADTDPIIRGVRDELTSIQHNMTKDGGWTPTDPAATHAFELLVDSTTQQVVSRPLIIMTTLVRFLGVTLLHGNFAGAVALLADVVADPSRFRGGLEPRVTAAIAHMLHEDDIPDGWRLYGLGVCSQAMSIHQDHPDARDIVFGDNQDALLTHPAVRAVWYAKLVAVDSRQWDMVRQQGEPLVYASTGPDDPLPPAMDGTVSLGDALTRLIARKTEPVG